MIKIPSVLLTCIMLISAEFTFAQTYRWVDEHGVTDFSEQEPDPALIQQNTVKTSKPNANQLADKESYLQERALLEQQISGTINDQRRDQLKRQLQMLDYQWYQKTDPAKAEALAKEMETPKVRVIQKKEDPNNMSKYKAFY